MKAIYYYAVDADSDPEIIHGYYEAENEIESEHRDIVKTSQMALLCNHYIDMGYRLFVHDEDGDYEICRGDCERTERILHADHNLCKLWISGEFMAEPNDWREERSGNE